MTDTRLLKVVVVGESRAGKSALVSRMCDDSWSDSFIATIGVDFKIIRKTRNDVSYKAQIWDTAGHERFRTITEAYYRGAHSFLFVFSIMNRKSFDEMQSFFDSVSRRNPSAARRSILIGTKCDLDDSQREVSDLEAKMWGCERGLRYILTSSKDNIGVSSLFDAIIDSDTSDHWKQRALDIAEVNERKVPQIRRLIDLQSQRELNNNPIKGIPPVITDKICRYSAWLPEYLDEILDGKEPIERELRKNAMICIEQSMNELHFAREMMNSEMDVQIEKIERKIQEKVDAEQAAREQLQKEKELFMSDPSVVHSLTFDTLKERVITLKTMLHSAMKERDWDRMDDEELALIRAVAAL